MKSNFFNQIPPQVLTRIKSIDLDVPSKNAHAAMNELLQRSVLLGGKRLRPLLTYLFGDFFDVSLSDLDTYAKAIEMVHAASLAHDDVIDGATTRRGAPSINIQASNKKSVLAGDYLLASVIGDLCREGRLELVGEMANVIELLSQGEWLQSDLIESRAYTRENLLDIAHKKTSSVMSWCSTAPALVKGHGNEVVNYCRQFGYHLGIAFQMIDDTLDFSGDGQKDGLLDLKNGQINTVLFEWLELHPEVKERFHRGEDIVQSFNEDHLDQALEKIRQEAKDHMNRCRDILDVLCSEVHGGDETLVEKKKKALLFIIDSLENRQY